MPRKVLPVLVVILACFLLARGLPPKQAGPGPGRAFRAEEYRSTSQATVLPSPSEFTVDPAWPRSTRLAAQGDLLLLEALSALAEGREQVPILGLSTGPPRPTGLELARQALENYEAWEAAVPVFGPDVRYDYSAKFGAERCREILGRPSAPTFTPKDRLACDFWWRRPREAFAEAWLFRLPERSVPIAESREHSEVYRQLSGGFFREDNEQAQLAAVKRALGDLSGKRIGDWGCGTGLLAAGVAEATGPTGAFVGADIAPSVLAFAQYAAEHDPRIPAGFSCSFVLSTADDSGFAPGSLDIVHTNIHLGGDWKEPRALAREVKPSLRTIRAALRPGGVFVVEECEVPLRVTLEILCSPEVGFSEPALYDPKGEPLSDWRKDLERTFYVAVFPR